MIDWIDPHGLWTASPDSPMASALRTHAREVIAELEAPPDGGPCPVTHELGATMAVWIGELRGLFDAAERTAPTMTPEQAFRFASLAAFEDGPIARPARSLATELGYRAGVVRRSLGAEGAQAARASRGRLVPEDSLDWATVILAGAVRAYLPQIDPHGGWAPLDEETSLYEIDLEASPPPRLWRKMTRTAVGVRIEETHVEGLAQGDIVLRVGDVPTAGLSVEQCEQLSFVDVEGTAPLLKRIAVLRAGDREPRVIDVRPVSEPRPVDAEVSRDEPGLEAERVPFGDGEVLVIPLGEVPDNLGEELGATLRRERGDALQGVILDLRGNGGGATDGAAGALGLFLPGAPLFPMRRRDGSVEVERAPLPPLADRWDGPVAAIVDGDTASAAEMISGALLAYHRGPVLGQRTYGKGCAQEYLDDDARVGVLRLTTLLYALPDGAPVQMTGLTPSVRLPMPPALEREANLAHALRPWRGPDVREAPVSREVPWPGHGGAIGPCKDPLVCRALRSLGAPRSPTARERR
jgi:carboxyl-terminal processing protease